MNAIMFTTGKGQCNVKVSELLPYLAFIIIYSSCNPFLFSYIFVSVIDTFGLMEVTGTFSWSWLITIAHHFLYFILLWDSLNLFLLFLSHLICCHFHYSYISSSMTSSLYPSLVIPHFIYDLSFTFHLSLSLSLHMIYLFLFISHYLSLYVWFIFYFSFLIISHFIRMHTSSSML